MDISGLYCLLQYIFCDYIDIIKFILVLVYFWFNYAINLLWYRIIFRVGLLYSWPANQSAQNRGFMKVKYSFVLILCTYIFIQYSASIFFCRTPYTCICVYAGISVRRDFIVASNSNQLNKVKSRNLIPIRLWIVLQGPFCVTR